MIQSKLEANTSIRHESEEKLYFWLAEKMARVMQKTTANTNYIRQSNERYSII